MKVLTRALALLISGACILSLCGCELFVRKPRKIETFLNKINPFEPDLKHKVESLLDIRDVGSDPTNFPNELKASFKIAGDLSRWSKASIGTDIVAPPVVGGGMFFVISKAGRVRCYDVEGRKLVWSASVCSSPVRKASMLLQDGRLYVAADDCLTSFSAKDGQEVFCRKLQVPIFSGLCVHKRVCYLQTMQGLYSIDIDTGATLGKVLGIPGEVSFAHQSSPVIYNDKLVFSSFAGRIAILDPNLSKHSLAFIEFVEGVSAKPTILPICSLVSQPLLDGKDCYFATSNGVVQKCDLNKREPVWSLDVPCVQSISLVGKTIFATTMAGQVAAINPQSSRMVWALNLESSGVGQYLAPFIVNGSLIVVSKTGSIFIIKPQTGELLSKVDLPTKETIISAAICGSKLMLFGSRGSIFESF